MYPAHTQLVAKWSSPSIGDQRATGCTDKSSLLKCSKLAPIFIPPIAILDIIIIMFGMPVRLQTQNLFQLLPQAPVFFLKSVNLLSLWRLNW